MYEGGGQAMVCSKTRNRVIERVDGEKEDWKG